MSNWKDALRTGAPRPLAELRNRLHAEKALVRASAFDALMTRYGLAAEAAASGAIELRSPLQRWKLLLSSDIKALHRPAAQSLEAILKRRESGASLEALGLVFDGGTPQFRQVLAASIQRGDPIPVARFASATPHDRRYGEALLAVQLDKPIRYRCPGALAALDARWTIPAMQEVLTSGEADAYMERELRAAVSHLLRRDRGDASSGSS